MISRNRLQNLLALVGLFAIGCSTAFAATLPVYNTGVSPTGVRLAVGSTDPHWQLVAGPGLVTPTQAIVKTDQHPSGQYYSTLDSAWIWGTAGGVAVIGAPYTFELQFDLTGYDASTALLSGFWGADNSGSIQFNGSTPNGTGTFSLAGSLLSNFNAGHAFSITSGFVTGINRLDITIVDSGNPGGLSVFGLSAVATPAPEPSSLVLFAGGLGLLTLVLRRKASRAGA